jgi:hypothetical protein
MLSRSTLPLTLVLSLAPPAGPLLASTTTCAEPEARAFDFWVGEWDVRNRHRRPNSDDPTWFDTGSATNRVYPILKGCAVVEHWRGKVGGQELIGFSVRAFDPVDREWDLVLLWPQPEQPSFGLLHGNLRHGRGEFFFENQNAAGQELENRYTFSDITPESLRWDSAVSDDGGLTWRTVWIMEFTRRPAGAAPLLNGHTSTHDRCTFPEIRAMDSLAGRWEGTTSDGASTPVVVESVPILEGCGAMDFATLGTGDDRIESFQVRTWEPARKAWVAWRMDTRSRVLHRLEGTLTGGVVALTGQVQGRDGTASLRSEWQQTPSGEVRWSLVERPAAPGAAATDLTVTLKRP